MTTPLSSYSTTVTNHHPTFSFESLNSISSNNSTRNNQSNSVNSLLYFNSSGSSMVSSSSDAAPTSISTTTTSTTSMTDASANADNQQVYTITKEDSINDINQKEQNSFSIQPNQTPTMLPTSSYTLQRPPGLHEYTSSISSISSTSSNSTSAPVSPALINYSPKHSRKPNSLNLNRNMKNLSLNLHDSTNGYTSPLPKSTNSNQSRGNFIMDSPSKKSTPVNRIGNNNGNDYINATLLQTPSITQTPTMPPPLSLAQGPPSSVGSESVYKFPPISNACLNYSAGDSDSEVESMSMKQSAKNTIIPPMAPPFALQSKSSPLSTPPRLHSPLGVDRGLPISMSPIQSSLNQKFNNITLQTPLNSSFLINNDEATNFNNKNNKNNNNNNCTATTTITNTILSTPQNVRYNSKKFHPPEELQELTSINAYPNGPKNVLNNLIYLYSDPAQGKIDINKFDLVINVAKECDNMSLQYMNQVPNQREYVYIPWSHNSNISKDLFQITNKIDQFFTNGRKILIHCQCGVSRSACVVVAFYMKKFQLGVNEAYELLKNGDQKYIDACDRICPNMNLIFELMEFGDKLNNNEISTQQLLMNSPPTINL